MRLTPAVRAPSSAALALAAVAHARALGYRQPLLDTLVAPLALHRSPGFRPIAA